jgi:hypothetical protein
MGIEEIDVQWADVKARRRIATVKGWMARNPDATMWRLAWSLWWRILLMALATASIVGIPLLMMWYGYG